jgi:hypothetical protein
MKNPPAFQFYPRAFLCYVSLHALSNADVGVMMANICRAAERGDFVFLKQFNFIGKIHIYSQYGRRHISSEIRKIVLSVGRCLLCECRGNLSVDHIIPVAKGGADDLLNLQCLCRRCNSRKGARV